MAEYQPVDLNYSPDALVLYCSDARFFYAHEIALEEHELKSDERTPDRQVFAGPSDSIVNEESREVVVKRIQALVGLHKDIKVVSIIDHYPCGWMGAVIPGYKEADDFEKIHIHKKHLKAASEILGQVMDGVRVETGLVGPDGKSI
jgi:carbonic anhydrase